ncbi:hypothetical protein Tco_0147629, partial [Tanacetum coccineum]
MILMISRAPNDQASSKVGKIKLANIATPNPFTTLDEEEDEEEDVKNIYDESKNLNIKNTGASSRIILGWNDDIVDVMIMAQTNQVMHVQVNTQADHKTLFCSFV